VEERQKNPMKQLAMQLAHSMDDQIRIRNEDVAPWVREEIRETHYWISNEIIKRGYNISTMLALAEEYKTLKWGEYSEWMYV
jgi:hypothetical protein